MLSLQPGFQNYNLLHSVEPRVLISWSLVTSFRSICLWDISRFGYLLWCCRRGCDFDLLILMFSCSRSCVLLSFVSLFLDLLARLFALWWLDFIVFFKLLLWIRSSGIYVLICFSQIVDIKKFKPSHFSWLFSSFFIIERFVYLFCS